MKYLTVRSNVLKGSSSNEVAAKIPVHAEPQGFNDSMLGNKGQESDTLT